MLHGEVPAAALMAVTGGAQVGEGEREWAGELPWEAGIPFPGSVGAGRGWKGELRGCSRGKRPWRTAAACLGKGRARLWLCARRGRGAIELGFVGWLSGDETATNGVSRGGDRVDGIPVNHSKFRSPVHKLSFSPSIWPQMKNF